MQPFNHQQKTNDFIQGYVEALLSYSDKDGGEDLHCKYGYTDISREAKEIIWEDCQKFLEENRILIAWRSMKMAGNDFCFSRNRHEWIGFDGGYGYWGDGITSRELAAAAQAYEVFHLYVGNDGKLHAMPPDPLTRGSVIKTLDSKP